jgi:predicted amidophosphoribosyltransferase
VPALEDLLSLLAPPRCVACGAAAPSRQPLCRSCHAALDALPAPSRAAIPGLDASWAAMPHEGLARELVAALKFRRLLTAAQPIAELIAKRAPARLLAGTIVAVPAAPSRSLRRGFDPAEEVAGRLAAISALPLSAPLRRADARPQVGRTRADRLCNPPRVWTTEASPCTVLLVDDVQTTGATLRACGDALRRAGAERVAAVTFARTL